MNTTDPSNVLVVTHTDRDGILSGAAMLRCLGDADGPDVLLTQGAYLADELEELADAGRTWRDVYVCDTYWHDPDAGRLADALRRVVEPGGCLAWIDHHPSSVRASRRLAALAGSGGRTRIRGDQAGQFEAVSLVAEAFGAADDPVVADLVKAAHRGFEREGGDDRPGPRHWLRVIDGLSRCLELPPPDAARIVRCLAAGFDQPVPPSLGRLEALSRQVGARTNELLERDWPSHPTVDGGSCVVLDLQGEPLANAYVLASSLFRASGRRIDAFVVAEHADVVHFVSGERARAERDRQERDRPPGLRVSTMHKGLHWCRSATRRGRLGIDLSYLTLRRPGGDAIEAWTDAHPYLVKGIWAGGVVVDAARVAAVAADLAVEVRAVLARYGWRDVDRRPLP